MDADIPEPLPEPEQTGSESKGKIPLLDLLSIRFPVTFSIPELGELEVEPMTAEFQTWARNGLKQGLWSTGEAMARSMMSRHAHKVGLEDALDASAIAAVSIDALDAACDQIVDNSGAMLRPKLIAEGLPSRQRIRRRRADELYDMGTRENEQGCDRLRRVITDWIQDHADHQTMSAQLLIPKHSAIANMVKQQSRALDLAEQYRRMVPNYEAIARASRMADALGLNSRMLGTDLSAISAAGRGLGASSWLKSLTALDRHRSILAITPPLLDVPSLGIVSILGESMSAALSSKHWDIFADQRGFMAAANRSFNLGLSAAAIAAMTTVATPEMPRVSRALSDAMALPPGFQLSAALGLAGKVSQGLTADILRYYQPDEGDDEPGLGEDFAVMREKVRSLDDGDLDARQADEISAVVREALSGELLKERDPVRRIGRLEIFGYLLTFILSAPGFYSAFLDHQSLDLAKAAARAPADPAGVAPRLDQLHKDIVETKAAAVADARFTRFIHQPAPLRADPDAEGLVLRIIYPDHQLRVIDERGAWVKVEVYDYHAGALLSGWISRKRLRHSPLE